MQEPKARPERAPKGYAFPTENDRLLAWSEVEARLVEARYYWLATTNPGGAAHVRPVWGAWIERAFYFDGHPRTRWARNIALDPHASIHLESAANVVIVEGVAKDLERTDERLGAAIASEWERKYGRLVPDAAGNGIFRLVPGRARAWSEDLADGTVWEF